MKRLLLFCALLNFCMVACKQQSASIQQTWIRQQAMTKDGQVHLTLTPTILTFTQDSSYYYSVLYKEGIISHYSLTEDDDGALLLSRRHKGNTNVQKIEQYSDSLVIYAKDSLAMDEVWIPFRRFEQLDKELQLSQAFAQYTYHLHLPYLDTSMVLEFIDTEQFTVFPNGECSFWRWHAYEQELFLSWIIPIEGWSNAQVVQVNSDTIQLWSNQIQAYGYLIQEENSTPRLQKEDLLGQWTEKIPPSFYDTATATTLFLPPPDRQIEERGMDAPPSISLDFKDILLPTMPRLAHQLQISEDSLSLMKEIQYIGVEFKSTCFFQSSWKLSTGGKYMSGNNALPGSSHIRGIIAKVELSEDGLLYLSYIPEKPGHFLGKMPVLTWVLERVEE